MPENSLTRKPENDLRAKLLQRVAHEQVISTVPSVIQLKAISEPAKETKPVEDRFGYV